MSLNTIAYGVIIFTIFFGAITFIFLSRFTRITRDKVYGISITVGTVPVCAYILVLVYQMNPHPNFLWLIIALLPLTGYYLFPVWYRLSYPPRKKK